MQKPALTWRLLSLLPQNDLRNYCQRRADPREAALFYPELIMLAEHFMTFLSN